MTALDGQAEQVYWDDRLSGIIRANLVLLGLAAAAGAGGAALGLWSWHSRPVAAVSMAVMTLLGGSLVCAYRRLARVTRTRSALLPALLLALALLAGFAWAENDAFREQVGREIVQRHLARLIAIHPDRLPALIDQLLERRTGSSGIEGYARMRIHKEGKAFLLPWGVRSVLVLLSALVAARVQRVQTREKALPVPVLSPHP